MGGQAYLNIHDIEEQGRTYSFYSRTPSSNGVFFWRFVEFPDKERIELTPQRDIAYVYTANKGYEITYKGARARGEEGSRRLPPPPQACLWKRCLRTWKNDPNRGAFL